MGLAGPRNRRKIQHDPNNTKWSRDETTFGQKILRAQGWEPGKFLGAQDAPHSHLHSAASAAPISVLMKDDTLGLGAKPKHKQNTECTGLDVFKDLLGRLNGKSEETIEKERQVRSGVKTNLYVERKYGLMNFVRGGLLVGDQMKDLVSTKVETLASVKEEDEKKPVTALVDANDEPTKKQKKEKKSKKRKAEDPDSTDSPDAVPEKKRKKRSKDQGSQEESAGSVEDEEPSKKKSKKSKRKDEVVEPDEPEKKKKSKKSRKDFDHDAENDDTPVVSEDARRETSKSKKEKKDRKKEKKSKKSKKQKNSEAAESSTDAAISTSSSTPALAATPQDSGVSTPTGTGTSAPQALSARHYARSRHIASKRMAIADMAALNQIFMVKPV
ncbi:hypothetical protein F5Y05DRAFT_366701 [Hypoxylon sp. FL0543]|nr:hypothetical protein F5Y05DRAFT_366701 [Hypoxylon sp. FL0543]